MSKSAFIAIHGAINFWGFMMLLCFVVVSDTDGWAFYVVAFTAMILEAFRSAYMYRRAIKEYDRAV